MRPHEGAGAGQGAAAVFQVRIPQVPSMNHVRPDFERHRDVRFARGGGEAHGIVEQRLVGADLNERRWKSAQIRIERRHPRILAIDRGRQIRARQFFEIGLMDQRVDGVFA
jgi:hypothetical protein